MTIQQIAEAVIGGKAAATQQEVKNALQAGIKPEQILSEGLIAAMSEVGARFERGEFYVPEMLIAARAMQSGLSILRPLLTEQAMAMRGKVVIGTVKGDLHDIGKNLVAMMLEGAGYEVVDLGTDVPPEKFASAVREHHPALVGMSALLTTTMRNMKETIEAIEDIGLRGQVKIIVGGAPLTEAFAKEVGADGYAPDASRAVALAKSLS
ncbi:MAG: corrinoid protein [Anaerolineales bacterium]|jgi:5-methyltetrahydrofolate--homocysteine methyltransferase